MSAADVREILREAYQRVWDVWRFGIGMRSGGPTHNLVVSGRSHPRRRQGPAADVGVRSTAGVWVRWAADRDDFDEYPDSAAGRDLGERRGARFPTDDRPRRVPRMGATPVRPGQAPAHDRRSAAGVLGTHRAWNSAPTLSAGSTTTSPRNVDGCAGAPGGDFGSCSGTRGYGMPGPRWCEEACGGVVVGLGPSSGSAIILRL